MKNRRFLLMTMLFLIMILSFTLAACQQQETPNNNEAIKVIAGVGTLKIDLEMKEPTADSSTYVSIKDSQAAIFDYDNWEPGYMDVKVLRISNKGSLALKWYAKFVSDYELSQLTNVIDVYVKLSATDITVNSRAEVMANWQKVGTVKDFVNTIETVMDNTLATSESQYLGIALTMQVDAGLEYNISLGGDFDILILATQQTAENDDVNDQYDKDAEFDEFVVRNFSTEAQLADVLSDTTKESPVVVNLKSDITVNTTINVVGDVTINLDKNTIVTSESVA
ncbi:MAG: hypothetical protein J6V68_04220, partial [Clostridia bacterium]|nr:hypothetical protein [Clostridia bacterium]